MTQDAQSDRTHFGYEEVSMEEKTRRVGQMFSSVARRYDIMNDLMSLGMHRVWKRQAIISSALRGGARILDLAAGTADMASLLYDHAGGEKHITVCDSNAAMLQRGRARMMDAGKCKGVDFVQGDAECLPFADNVFDCIVIAFGLRNITNKERALLSMHRKLSYGGQLLILELSKVSLPMFTQLYDAWSFKVVPFLGKVVAGDAASYRYLVESVRKHPDQDALANMLTTAGFGMVDYVNLSGGIVALHKGYKL